MRTAHEDAPTLDPLAEGFFEDPYPQYAQLREHNPIHSVNPGVTLCFAFEDVRRVLIDPKSTSMDRVRALSLLGGDTPPAAPPTFPLSLLNQDSPDHNRLRRLMSPAFTQRNIERRVAWMEAEVDQLLDALEHDHRETGEPVDLIGALAFPFPFTVISQLLGMPPGEDLQVRSWAHDISSASDPIVARENVRRSVDAYEAMCDYMNATAIPWKREHLGDDLFSHLLAAEGDGSLSRDEMLDNVALLYVAGHETTSGLIGNGVLNLLRHRHQLELLQSDPSLMPNAVEELNRYEGSIQFAWRYVIEDMEVGGTVLRPGSMAFVCCGSANRDADHFGDQAEVLDITRADAKDGLSFGAGMHFCLGAHLARREVGIVIGRLIERFPDLELAASAEWSRGMTFRQLRTLPVSLGTTR